MSGFDGKIFCIGFHKTGTRSLGKALTHLGYRVQHRSGAELPDIAQRAHGLMDDLVPNYDAVRDNPWPLLYRELDAGWPGSRFILTVRPYEAWFRSARAHFGVQDTPMREWIYGPGAGHPVGNRKTYIARYQAHNAAVLDYFRERPLDLLVMRLTEGDGWERLCPFLDHPIPDLPFPHAGSRSQRPGRTRRLLDRIAGRLKTHRTPS